MHSIKNRRIHCNQKRIFHRKKVVQLSMQKIPDITPTISLKRCFLIYSIAMEEIGLSHILSAEGEKIQHFLSCNPHHLKDYLMMNKSINRVLRTIVNSQITLLGKLEEINEILEATNNRMCKQCLSKEKRCDCSKTFFQTR